ncbi:MAG: ABC transporter ATP-binding protein, partial [Alphaproteobacteria bacterium]|nr:ABC transporter ATP-binding protein [Alphaproteobacteria bacterium]
MTVAAISDAPPPAPPLLEVRDLVTRFATDGSAFNAVDGVSFALAAGEVLGIVGESGCGKSVTALSIMRLVARPAGAIAGGSVAFQGRDLLALPEAAMRDLRGDRMAMIFLEPMTALNPVLAVGAQVG